MPEECHDNRTAANLVPPAETPGLAGLLTLAVAVVVIAGLYLGRTVLIPITLAVLLSFLLAPLVDLLRRIRLGRLLSGAARRGAGSRHRPGTRRPDRHPDCRSRQEVPQYASTIREKIDTVQSFATSRLSPVMRRLDTDRPRRRPPRRPEPAPAPPNPSRCRWRCTSRIPARCRSPNESSRRSSTRCPPPRSCWSSPSSSCCSARTCATG